MTIELPKICYFKGEIMKGTINIKPKPPLMISLLSCPLIAHATLKEFQIYKDGVDDGKEEYILFKYPLNVEQFDKNTLTKGLIIPFEFQIPYYSYPSFFLDNLNNVKHILTFVFTTIEARKSIVIIIKNDQYFNENNQLYKSPAVVSMRTSKHKYAIFHMGHISASLKLKKNAFTYNETIPLEIDIDCSTLKIKIINIHLSIYRVIKKNIASNHKEAMSKDEKNIFTKTIPLNSKKDHYHIEESIRLPKGNPGDIYSFFNSKSKRTTKLFDLFASCYGGLLSCEYFIKVTFETNTLFSTDEFLLMPIDFYEQADNDNIDIGQDSFISRNSSDILSKSSYSINNPREDSYNYSNTFNNVPNFVPVAKRTPTGDFS
jgi:hypothetical protein